MRIVTQILNTEESNTIEIQNFYSKLIIEVSFMNQLLQTRNEKKIFGMLVKIIETNHIAKRTCQKIYKLCTARLQWIPRFNKLPAGAQWSNFDLFVLFFFYDTSEEKFLTSDFSFSQVTKVDKTEPRESFSKPRPHF